MGEASLTSDPAQRERPWGVGGGFSLWLWGQALSSGLENILFQLHCLEQSSSDSKGSTGKAVQRATGRTLPEGVGKPGYCPALLWGFGTSYVASNIESFEVGLTITTLTTADVCLVIHPTSFFFFFLVGDRRRTGLSCSCPWMGHSTLGLWREHAKHASS